MLKTGLALVLCKHRSRKHVRAYSFEFPNIWSERKYYTSVKLSFLAVLLSAARRFISEVHSWLYDVVGNLFGLHYSVTWRHVAHVNICVCGILPCQVVKTEIKTVQIQKFRRFRIWMVQRKKKRGVKKSVWHNPTGKYHPKTKNKKTLTWRR